MPRYTLLLSAAKGPVLRFEEGKLVGVGNNINDGGKVNLDQ